MLTLNPVSFSFARQWIRENHSHLSPPQGWLFGVAVLEGDRVCCVATLGRPTARALQDGTTAEITRVASDRTKNASSMAIAALTRAAFSLGYKRVVSYIRFDEKGTSYLACGFKPAGIVKGREWSCPSRIRKPSEQPVDKVRMERHNES